MFPASLRTFGLWLVYRTALALGRSRRRDRGRLPAPAAPAAPSLPGWRHGTASRAAEALRWN